MQQKNRLLSIKTNPPTIYSKLTIRQRLHKMLDQYKKHKLISITSPAGYGKTTLVASWLKEKTNQDLIITWLSLDKVDNDPDLFWSYFFMSFYQDMALPSSIHMNHALLDNSHPICNLHFINFLNDIKKLDKEVIMVIDDIHVIEDVNIIEGLQFILKYMPINMHLIFIGRNVSNFRLSRLRVEGSILEIPQSELSFTPKETGEFFYKLTALRLEPEECDELNDCTEGWIAAMHLLSISISLFNKNHIKDYILKNSNHIFEYLAEEIFNQLDKSLKDFLVWTSLLTGFSIELSDYMLDIKNSAEIIKEIKKRNLFIIGINEEENWYRYHILFKYYLMKQIKDRKKEAILYGRIAEWFEIAGDINQAVEYYMLARKYCISVNLIEKHSGKYLCKGMAKNLKQWNEKLPQNIVNTNYRLILNSAWAMLSKGNYNEVSSLIKQVKCLEGAKSSVKAEIIALETTILAGLNVENERIINDCKKGLELLQFNNFIAQLITFNLASAYLFQGEISKGIDYYTNCLSISQQAGEAYMTILANKALQLARVWRGEYEQVKKEGQEILLRFNKYESTTLPTMGIVYCGLAEVLYQQNELDEALELAVKGLNLGLSGQDSWTICESYFMLSKIYYAIGARKEYLNTIDELNLCIKDVKYFNLELRYQCENIRIKLQNNKYEGVRDKINEIETFLEAQDINIGVYPEVYILKSRYYIINKQYSYANDLLKELESIAKKHKLRSLLIELYISYALMYNQKEDKLKSLETILMALKIASETNTIRTFIKEKYWIRELLIQLKDKSECNTDSRIKWFIERLLKNIKNATIIKDDLLSSRELEVLDYIRKGTSNAEIAKNLYISINTVKTHLKNIYAKLDVNNRGKAILKAKKLKII